MRVVLHRVDRAEATRDGVTVVEIGRGLVALVGFSREDDAEVVRRLAGKIARLRIMEGADSKFGASVVETGGQVLTLSQFTLLADTTRGSKPNFSPAAEPAVALELFGIFGEALRAADVADVVQGPFGTTLVVEMVHRGPFTVVLEG